MSDCNKFCIQLILYLDNELKQREKALVEVHLKECAVCREVLARERGFQEGVAHDSPLYTAPESLRTRVASIIAATPVTPPVNPLRAARRILFGHDNHYFKFIAQNGTGNCNDCFDAGDNMGGND